MGKRLAHRPVDQSKQAAILAAARTEFFGVGYAAASIERIAAIAQVSKVTIYNHFQSKENLFAATVENECSRMRVELASLGEGNGDLRHNLIQFAKSMMNFLTSPDIIRFERRLAAEVDQHPAMGELFLEAGPRCLRAMLTDLIGTAISNGQLAAKDAYVAAGHLHGIIKGFSDIEWRFTDAEQAAQMVDDRVLEEAVDRFLRAYSP